MTTDTRDLRETDDDGFHEIQLSGKQLVFLCMATTVVSIVIFLCGVLVGRGVRPVEPVAEAATVAVTDPLPGDASLPPVAQPDAPPAGRAQAEPTPQPDAPPAEKTSPRPAATASAYTPAAPASAKPADPAPSRPVPAAKADTPAKAAAPPPPKTDTAKTDAAKPAAVNAGATPAKPVVAPPALPTPAPPSAPAAGTAKPAAASGGAIAVQVGALRERADADALARRLSGKGYAAYIVPPDAGTANPVYKVRVGNFTSPDEAARVKRRLEQEEKLKPWIIR